MTWITSLWNGLDSRRRLLAAAAAGLAALAVWGLARMASEPAMGLLYAGLDAPAIGGVVSALEARGAPYEIRGDAVFVAEGERDALRMALAAEGQPQSGAAGYELLDGLSGFGTTAQMFDAAYWRAKEGELARTILALPNVRRARVHIANPVRRPFERGAAPTASVAVGVGAGELGPEQARAIRFLVSSAVAGLAAGDVTVVDAENGAVLSEEAQPGAATGPADRAEALEADILRLLEARVGPDAAVVEVMIDADMDSETVRERVVDPASRVAIHTDTQESTETERGPAGGGVTVASNLPDGEAEGPDRSRNAAETRERVNYEVSEVLRERVRRPGEIRRISVAVMVDGLRAPGPDGAPAWRPRPEEEMQALRELVETAIGFDPARGDKVTIRSLEFTRPPALGVEAASGGAAGFLARNAMSLIQLAVFGLVALMLGLFVLRPVLARREEDLPALELEAEPEALAAPQAVESSIAAAGEVIDADGVAAERIAALRAAAAERRDEAASLLGAWLQTDESAKEQA